MIYYASLFLVLAGLVSVGLGASARRYSFGLGFGLDLWAAAGLLKLSSALEWERIAVVGLIILVRHLLTIQPATLRKIQEIIYRSIFTRERTVR